VLGGNSHVSQVETVGMASRYVVRRQYRRFNTLGTQFTVRLLPPPDNSVNDRFEHMLRDVDATDMVGMTIQNRVNQNDKPIGIRFRRKEQLSGDVIWSVVEKMAQSNARYTLTCVRVVNKCLLYAITITYRKGFALTCITPGGMSAMHRRCNRTITLTCIMCAIANIPAVYVFRIQ
jgi:hypothetical protein